MSIINNGSVIAGTPGAKNWTYPSGNPLIKAHFLINNQSYPGFYYLTDKEFSQLSQNELNALFNAYYGAGGRSSYTGYKMAWYFDGQTYAMYQNINGVVGTGQQTGNKAIAIAKTETGFIHVSPIVIDSTHPYIVNDSIPVFDQVSDINSYLLNANAYATDSDITNATGTYDGMLSSGTITRAFKIDDANLREFAQLIGLGVFGGNLATALIGTKLIMTPGALDAGNSETIVSKTIGGTPYDVTGNPIVKQGQKFDFGTFSFEENFHNFLDYSDTTIKIYLPYSGLYDLDASVVMGGSIHLYGVIDVVTANITYYLEVINPDVTCGSASNVLYSFTGNCGCDIPITTEDYGRKISTLASGVFKSVAAVATGGATAPITALEGLASSGAETALSTSYISTGSIQSNNGLSMVQYPYVIISTPKALYPTNYAHDVGFPCEKDLLLGSLSGFTKVERIHLNIPGALDDELKEIESLLAQGIVL